MVSDLPVQSLLLFQCTAGSCRFDLNVLGRWRAVNEEVRNQCGKVNHQLLHLH